MRSLWTVLSIVLVINLFAAAGFLGWLYADGRLNRERANQVVELFSVKVADEAVAKEQEAIKKKREADEAREAARLERVADGPAQLAHQIAEDQERDEIALQRLERLKRDIQDLQRTNEVARRLLAEERAKLDIERKAFADALAGAKKKSDDEDFKQAVKMYEQLKAKQAKEMFQALMVQKKTDQVLDYLAAMQIRKAAAVLKEFKTTAEVAQATELVQRLRERGINIAPQPQARGPSGDDL
jgi:hypothetical protein